MRSSNMDEALPTPRLRRERAEPRWRATSRPCCASVRNGAVVSNRGGSEELAETVAYAQRLVQLAGELLGLERVLGARVRRSREGRCIIFTEGDGEIVALRPRPEANLEPLREKLGL